MGSLRVRIRGSLPTVLDVARSLGIEGELHVVVPEEKLLELVKECVRQGLLIEILPSEQASGSPTQLPNAASYTDAQRTSSSGQDRNQVEQKLGGMEQIEMPESGETSEILMKYRSKKRKEPSSPSTSVSERREVEAEKPEASRRTVESDSVSMVPSLNVEISEEEEIPFDQIVKLKDQAFSRNLLD